MKVLLDHDDAEALISCLQHAKDPCASKMIAMLRKKMESSELMDRLRAAAKAEHHEDGVLEFDDHCVVSIDDTPGHVPDGAYVQGWTWVPNPDLDEPFPFSVPGLGCEVIGLKRGKYITTATLAVAVVLKWDKPEEGGPDREDQIISVNITDAGKNSSNHLPEGVFYAKNWSENMTIYQALIDNGIIHETGPTVAAGHSTAPACRITPKGLKWTTDDLN